MKTGVLAWLGYTQEKGSKDLKDVEDLQTMYQEWEKTHLERMGTSIYRETQLACRWKIDCDGVSPSMIRYVQ